MSDERFTRPASAFPKYGIPEGGGRAVRIQSATLDRIPAEEVEEVAEATETEEQKIHRAVYCIGNAHRFSTWYSSYRRPSGRLPGLEDAQVTVEKTLEDSRGEPNGYDGEYAQGTEGEIGIIFKVTFDDGTELHLKKIGYQDSYGSNENWDGPFRVGRPKLVTVYE